LKTIFFDETLREGTIGPEWTMTGCRALVQATPRQVLQDGIAPMLLGNDVFHLKREWIEAAWNAAIVKPIASKPANLIQKRPDARCPSRWSQPPLFWA
jgi:hypothetical protein